MVSQEERRKWLRRISDSELPRSILAAILLILFLHLALKAVELVDRFETKLQVPSRAGGAR
jgi:hypothetical protein